MLSLRFYNYQRGLDIFKTHFSRFRKVTYHIFHILHILRRLFFRSIIPDGGISMVVKRSYNQPYHADVGKVFQKSSKSVYKICLAGTLVTIMIKVSKLNRFYGFIIINAKIYIYLVQNLLK